MIVQFKRYLVSYTQRGTHKETILKTREAARMLKRKHFGAVVFPVLITQIPGKV